MRRTGLTLFLAGAFLAAPIIAAAQAAPPPPENPQGPPMGQQWRGRQGMGPGMGMQQWRGQRGPMMGRFGRGPRMRGFGQRMGQRGFGRQGGGMGRFVNNPLIRERLGITPEQAAKIQSQESAFAQGRIRSRADLHAKRLELSQLMRAEKPDRTAIDKKLREFYDARLATEKTAMEHRFAMRDAFTPEQKQKLEEMRKERMQQWQQRGPGMRGPGPMMGPLPQTPPAPPKPPADDNSL